MSSSKHWLVASGLVATISFAASSCSAGTQTSERTTKGQPIDWRQLPDRSVTEGYDLPKSVSVRRRCWPASNGFDCIVVSAMDGSGSILRWQVSTLPMTLDDPGLSPPLDVHGYACDYVASRSAIIETANGPAGATRENVVSLNGTLPYSRPWSPRKASEALAMVGSTQLDTHFDCMEIASQIFAKGILAIESPSITRQIFN